MTLQKKEKPAPASESVDEIDEIMNEIEELQQSMAASQASAPAPTAKTASCPVKVEPAPAPVAEEPNVMEEFQAGSGEVSMEETLSNLKDDEPSGPNLIDQVIEAESAPKEAEEVVAMAEPAAEVHEEADEEHKEHAETPEEIETEIHAEEAGAEQDELLDEAETEALDEAVAEEEQAILEEVETAEEQEEEVTMAETPRRGHSSGTVSLKLTGDMVLRLSYEFEGQDVKIGFSDGALRVELSDGTEFKIPVRRNSLRKVA